MRWHCFGTAVLVAGLALPLGCQKAAPPATDPETVEKLQKQLREARAKEEAAQKGSKSNKPE